MNGQFWAAGECMLELRPAEANRMHTTAAGDTYNTAVYLKRLLPDMAVHYVSALGDDAVSAGIAAQMRANGIDDSLVAILPGALPGLYTIATDARGERRFSYWRQQSAARRMLGPEHLDQLRAAAAQCRCLLLTGISLAILDDERRAALLALAAELRARGAWVVLDNNFRPALWPADTAREWLQRALQVSTHALLSFDDEALLHGDADPQAAIDRALGHGCEEVVIKMGEAGCVLGLPGQSAQAIPATPAKVVDTTAAGDSFNAGYLAGRLAGHAPRQAAAIGGDLAAIVVGHAGAIIAPEHMLGPIGPPPGTAGGLG